MIDLHEGILSVFAEAQARFHNPIGLLRTLSTRQRTLHDFRSHGQRRVIRCTGCGRREHTARTCTYRDEWNS